MDSNNFLIPYALLILFVIWLFSRLSRGRMMLYYVVSSTTVQKLKSSKRVMEAERQLNLGCF